MSADEFGPGPFPFKLEEEFLFSGSPTLGDIRAAKRLIAPGYGRKVAVLCGAILVFAILLLAVAVSTRPYSPQAANTIFMVVCVGFPLLLCVPVLIQNVQRRKRARERTGEFQPIEAKLSRSGVSVCFEGEEAKREWAVFSHCVSNEVVLLLYRHDGSPAVLLAKSQACNKDVWVEMLHMIDCQIGLQADF